MVCNDERWAGHLDATGLEPWPLHGLPTGLPGTGNAVGLWWPVVSAPAPCGRAAVRPSGRGAGADQACPRFAVGVASPPSPFCKAADFGAGREIRWPSRGSARSIGAVRSCWPVSRRLPLGVALMLTLNLSPLSAAWPVTFQTAAADTAPFPGLRRSRIRLSSPPGGTRFSGAAGKTPW